MRTRTHTVAPSMDAQMARVKCKTYDAQQGCTALHRCTGAQVQSF